MTFAHKTFPVGETSNSTVAFPFNPMAFNSAGTCKFCWIIGLNKPTYRPINEAVCAADNGGGAGGGGVTTGLGGAGGAGGTGTGLGAGGVTVFTGGVGTGTGFGGITTLGCGRGGGGVT